MIMSTVLALLPPRTSRKRAFCIKAASIQTPSLLALWTLKRERLRALQLNSPLTMTWIIWQLISPLRNLGKRFSDFRPSSSKIRRIRPVEWGDPVSEVTRRRQKGCILKWVWSQRRIIWQLKIQKMAWIFTRSLRVALKSFRLLKVKTCTGAKTTSRKRGMMPFCRSEWMRPNYSGDREQMWAEAPGRRGAFQTRISLYRIPVCSPTWNVKVEKKQSPQYHRVSTHPSKTRKTPRPRTWPSHTSRKQTWCRWPTLPNTTAITRVNFRSTTSR